MAGGQTGRELAPEEVEALLAKKLAFHDRAGEDPEGLERLRSIADAYLETVPRWGEAPTRELDELELRLLRALGYKIE